jgi:hypothetical protein
MKDHFTINHFSLGLPAGEGQSDVMQLLRHLATTIESMEEKIEVQDLVFTNHLDNDGQDWPSFTIYYHRVK